MSCRRHNKKSARQSKQRQQRSRRECVRWKNLTALMELVKWCALVGELFTEDTFHGNIKWKPEELVTQAIIWSWQETKNVTDAFGRSVEICRELGMTNIANNYPSFMNGLHRHADIFTLRLRQHYQKLAEEVSGPHFRSGDWVPIGFDGSRSTAPRTVSNEQAFCAPKYGHGKTAKYRKKKSKGMRRKHNQQNPQQPQAPQVWMTMMWHMGLRLPWTWRLGPSHSSERDHVKEMLAQEMFPKNTLFCGDAGFVGYPLWSAIAAVPDVNFLVRVGANVSLLSQQADLVKKGDGIVHCWPKGQMNSGAPPLRLRLLHVKIGKRRMWMLTNVCDRTRLSKKQIVAFYKMRWGIEVEFRGLKQTLDKHMLRSRNSDRLMVELDWSIRGMAYAELIATREQISSTEAASKRKKDYNPRDRSLANTIRALRNGMRRLHKDCDSEDSLFYQLAHATVQRYRNRTNKKSRYRPKNPDKKPLGDPSIRKMTAHERKRLKEYEQNQPA
jgi:Transposase DDE domain